MKTVADIVMFAWIPAVLLLFGMFPPRRAVLYAYLFGWLFLPFHSYTLPLFPDFTKMSATTCGVLLGMMIFDLQRVASFRMRWFDLPIAVFCAAPLFSSITNGLGIYDGVSEAFNQLVTWGLPYFVGRLYFNDAIGIRELAIAIFVGGLIYIPFCLFEIRMSPMLHILVYGEAHRASGGATIRLGGYRPTVFLDTGLQLGMWMTVCSLIGYWLLRTRALAQLRGISMSWLAPLLIIVTILCRSTGAIALLLVGMVALMVSRAAKTQVALWCLLLIAPLYLTTRITGIWDGRQITSAAGMLDSDRASSFQFRIDNENMLVDKALQRPVFGWGSWGRNRVVDDRGEDISVPDGLWVIELGKHGFVGMVSLYTMMLLPLALLLVKSSSRSLVTSNAAPVLALGVVVVLYAIDCLPNAMLHPIFVLVAGAVASCAANGRWFATPAENAPLANGASNNSQAAQVPRRRLTAGRF